jgi:rare lipoprotein A (peptidoglycan hydrolase)
MRCYRVIIFSLSLTIGLGVASRTPPASTPITVSPTPSIYLPPLPRRPPAHEVLASWYGRSFTGRPTTSGERFDPHRFTAASVSIPLGSVVKVENPKNGRSVKVRINDCGPYARGRSLDLSLGAAQKIGIDRQGVTRLKVTPINIPSDADAERCSR